jgi:hexosaminidase
MNQRIHSVILFTVFLCSCGRKYEYSELSTVPIIPQPVYVESGQGVFELNEHSIIYVDEAKPEWLSVAEALAEKIRPSTGFKMNILVAQQPTLSGIRLTSVNDPEIDTEGYRLDITEKLLTVSANTAQGAFRGIQTIRQMFPASIELSTRQDIPWQIPAGVILDFPGYAYRGAMLDVARHFFSVSEVKQFIDLISLYKINYLHLHLSDDQGWRIEIKSWPNLTLHGGKTEVGGGEGGYYTQEQYKEIIKYAQERYITIVPEIDMPGHINSALASYGELNGGTIVPVEGRLTNTANSNKILDGKSKPTELYTGIEVGWSTLRLEKEATFRFVEDVIREISAITPGPYFHIGGDEAQVTKKEDYVQFINRFQQIVKANGKTMMGWEEIAQGEIGANAIVQHWNLPKYAMMAVEKGCKLVMSPAKKAYLDMSYDSTSSFGLHWAAFIEVDSAYSWNPATYIDGIPKENIMGIEAPLWSETISNMDEVEYLLFPRLPGYAEIGWSQEKGRSWEEYKVRLGKHAPRFKVLNIDFYRSKRVPWVE